MKRRNGALVGTASVVLCACAVAGCGSSSASGTVTQTVIAPLPVSSGSPSTTPAAGRNTADRSVPAVTTPSTRSSRHGGSAGASGADSGATASGSSGEASDGVDMRGKVSAPGLVELPDVEGMTYSQAAALVRARGFQVARRTAPSTGTPGIVTYVSPRLLWLDPGSLVTLVVSVSDTTTQPTQARTNAGGNGGEPTRTTQSAPAQHATTDKPLPTSTTTP